MTTDQVLLGVGVILVLAVGSQVLASRLRMPAIIILLPAGFIAGALTTDVNPQRLLGAAFQPLVSLSVAVILLFGSLARSVGGVPLCVCAEAPDDPLQAQACCPDRDEHCHVQQQLEY